jgi:hypothetical protein
MYYGTEILSAAGFSERTSLICNVLNGVFSVGGMLIGVLFLVDRSNVRQSSSTVSPLWQPCI